MLFLPLAVAYAQSSPPDSNDASEAAAPVVSIHGVVTNAASGEPLARVLVTVEGQSGKAALTDWDGRFEIPGIPAGGTVPIDLTKPGFEDAAGPAGGTAMWASSRGIPHTVTVAADMPDLQFAMRPLNAIRGQIELLTGEPGEGFRVELYKRTVSQGRLQWQVVGVTVSNADGAFRFGSLSDGVYTVAIQPSIDGDGGMIFQVGGKSPLVRTGYARTFYPDARSLLGAGLIRVAGGQTAPANFTLRQEQFRLVQAAVSGPGLDSLGGGAALQRGVAISRNGAGVSVAMSGLDPEVTDTRGHALPYRAEYDAKSHTVQALLPDGDYSLRVTAFGPSKPFVNSSGGIVTNVNNFLSGQADVSVAGRAVTNLRIAMGPESSNALDVIVNRTGAEPPPQNNGSGPGIFISATQAGPDASDPMSTQFAQGSVPGTLDTQPLAPGSYWLYTNSAQAGLCESSFTAGGANLAREPLVVSTGGATAPLTLTLRDDCASLQVSLQQQFGVSIAGESPMVYVYVVPDFDSTAEVQQNVLQSVYSRSVTVEHLTPGAYHVYALTVPVNLPFRDPDAMAALNLQGQAVTLSPGASTDLVLEVPAP